jgi:hypothetical protein
MNARFECVIAVPITRAPGSEGLHVDDLHNRPRGVDAHEIGPYPCFKPNSLAVVLELGRQAVQRIVGGPVVTAHGPEAAIEGEIPDGACDADDVGSTSDSSKHSGEGKDEGSVSHRRSPLWRYPPRA